MSKETSIPCIPSTTLTRSRAGTPVKTVRRNSSRSGGGLTPLPDEDLPTIILSPTSTRAPTPSSSCYIKDTASRQDIQNIQNQDGGQNSTDMALDLEMDSDEHVRHLLVGREEWESIREEVHANLRNLQQSGGGGDAMDMDAQVDVNEDENDNRDGKDKREMDTTEPSTDTQPTDPTDEKIRRGLLRIQELDKILKEKNMVAKSLKRTRLSRESSSNTLTPSSTHQQPTTSDSDSDSDNDQNDDTKSIHSLESLELKSVRSMDTRTFITEPKLESRVKIGVQRLRQSGGEEDTTTKPPLKKPKGYKQGDFIQRNIVLGPEARYYCAMTEEEKERVENILQLEEDNNDTESDIASTNDAVTSPTPISTRPPTAFFPDTESLTLLTEIDKKLQLFIPPPEWDAKSIIWSTPASSGTQTPVSSRWSLGIREGFGFLGSGRVRDLDTVLNDTELIKPASTLLHDEQKQLKEIDERLQALRESETEPESRPLSREDLDRLLYECMRSDAELKSRQSSAWDIESVSTTSRSSSRAYSEIAR